MALMNLVLKCPKKYNFKAKELSERNLELRPRFLKDD
jgi:hypothetical protein